MYEPRPSENDLVDHMKFINEIVKRDGKLAQSKVCMIPCFDWKDL